MSTFLELHLVQNFAPSNLNRDDTGAPKDAIFGGHRRARISSQCLKHAVRNHFRDHAGMAAENTGLRTKKLVDEIARRLEDMGYAEPKTRIKAVLAALKLGTDDGGNTEYLLFLGRDEIDAFTRVIAENWDALATNADDGAKKKGKKDPESSIPKEIVKQANVLFQGNKAIDVALFGRMLADRPEANVDAACQVAHAISTHRVEREFDYFTAVDDLSGADEPGAGMIGTIEFNSACFYRYSSLSLEKLIENLGGDHELARVGAKAFIEAAVEAIPTGKQNTFAAHNPPEYIGVCLRKRLPRNLANAFESPVWPKREEALSTASVARLSAKEQAMQQAYGQNGDVWFVLDLTGAWTCTTEKKTESMSALIDAVNSALKELGETER